jgi:hypothetical protein
MKHNRGISTHEIILSGFIHDEYWVSLLEQDTHALQHDSVTPDEWDWNFWKKTFLKNKTIFIFFQTDHVPFLITVTVSFASFIRVELVRHNQGQFRSRGADFYSKLKPKGWEHPHQCNQGHRPVYHQSEKEGLVAGQKEGLAAGHAYSVIQASSLPDLMITEEAREPSNIRVFKLIIGLLGLIIILGLIIKPFKVFIINKTGKLESWFW